MADMRIPTNLPVTPAGRSGAPSDRSEAVQAAQRAFFDAAMNGTSVPTTLARPAAAQSPAPAPASRIDKFEFDPQNPPERLLRPGSLVDIKV